MNGYNFTERVRKTLAISREEAARLHHEYVGTEHILLGLIREGGGVGFDVLQRLDADLTGISETIEKTVKRGRDDVKVGPDLPYTSRAKKVLELAMAEARELNHSYVGTEHLLLGLLREEKGIAAQVLVDHGVTLERARAATLELLGSQGAPGPLERLPKMATMATHAPMRDGNDGFDPQALYAVLMRYHAAYAARDMEQMREIWSRSDRTSRIAPDHKLVSGWPDVAESYRKLFAKTAHASISTSGDMLSGTGAIAFVVSVEVWTAERDGTSAQVKADTTRIFRHEGWWRLVHEHASAALSHELRAYRELVSGA